MCVFVRLDEWREWEGMMEVPIPTRFLFLCVGPRAQDLDYYQIGRSMATIMSTLVSAGSSENVFVNKYCHQLLGEMFFIRLP